MRDGKAYATDWWQIIFNPSMPYRLSHMMLASFLTASFLVAGISAYRWLRGDKGADVKTTLKGALVAAAVLAVAQIVVGDMHGLNTLHWQPAKVAAMEGVWRDERGAPLLLFAIPDEASNSNKWEIGIPRLGSLILRHDVDGEIKGIESFGKDRPKVMPVFFAFRAMVGMGMLMLAVAWGGSWIMRRARGGVDALPDWMARVLVAMSFSGWVATLAGWYVAEIGRQPYVVYGVLTAADAASKTASSGMVATSLAMYLVLYVVLGASYVWTIFLMARKAAAGAAKTPEGMEHGK